MGGGLEILVRILGYLLLVLDGQHTHCVYVLFFGVSADSCSVCAQLICIFCMVIWPWSVGSYLIE